MLVSKFDFGTTRSSFDLAYYDKKTTDLLLDCPIPHTTGFTTVYKNIGSVKKPRYGLDDQRTSGSDSRLPTGVLTINLNFNKNKIPSVG